MFGYIRIFKPELTFREYEQYRGIYCSLCEALGRRYGLAARMTLSYDFTFLSMFHIALSDTSPSFRVGRCPFRPSKKRAFCCGDTASSLDFSADVAVILTYHKLTDTVSDEHGFKKLGAYVARAFIKHDFQKAISRCPQEAEWAEEFMNAHAMIEQSNGAGIDAAAHPTAEFLAKLASMHLDEGEMRDTAWRFGYGLGRFIYLCDAAEDAADDVKRHRYNVFAQCYPKEITAHHISEHVKDDIAQTLHQTAAVCAECYEQLPIRHFDSIMRNILYCGIPSVIHRICHGAQEDRFHEKSL